MLTTEKITTGMITKEQWSQLQQQLASSHVVVTLELDGNRLTIERRHMTENRTALCVFINGSIRIGSGWPDSDHFSSLTEKVWRKRSKALYGPAKIKQLEKELGKRGARQVFSKLDKTIEWFDPTFNTAASLVRQFKRLQGLTLVSINGQPVQEAA
ncbi:hypothetical protein [Parathalassolituus penaei]|uniref:Uncharacterized protein n=1 Tax=Parathalassolituus penaei TaxID=2997323 RepID=A0A9X3ITC1_9GAMM|nr:hypothetical protein [Parathalassolituus penaei]MCY0966155.1 hypothetical protein [Parathalassolituus penaei]